MIGQLRDHVQSVWGTLRIPDGVRHRFDQPCDGTRVQKTTRRHVVTLELSRFEAVEVVRTAPDSAARHAAPLAALVPKGGTYGYDLIAHVGVETFLKGKELKEVAAELRYGVIPLSSLHDLQLKFLFYFGQLHRQAAPRLRELLLKRGHSTWLIDSTLEPGTPVYFGVREAHFGLFLGAWKVATENADELIPCLREADRQFGAPSKVLHDLSDAMHKACEGVWGSAVGHYVCHFHLLRDIGEDLYAKPQAALRELVRTLKLQPRLKEQRRGQTEWLRDHVAHDSAALSKLLQGQTAKVPSDVLGRELLLAFHHWILDYPSDGQRQGFPFDPYLLYFHRRVACAAAAAQRLLSEPAVRQQVPSVLQNFLRMLQDYLNNARVRVAAEQFEHAYELFATLRTALRLTPQADNPLRDPYTLDGEPEVLQGSLEQLRQEWREKARQDIDPQSVKRYEIVVTHLDRYWNRLFAPGAECRERTTNRLESHWGAVKRCCRKRHGRRKLTRDFHCMPAELMLIPNLENARYLELVLGDLRHLPARLAEAGRTAEPWTNWRRNQQPLTTGRLPKRLLRTENLIDRLVTTYDQQCQAEVA